MLTNDTHHYHESRLSVRSGEADPASSTPRVPLTSRRLPSSVRKHRNPGPPLTGANKLAISRGVGRFVRLPRRSVQIEPSLAAGTRVAACLWAAGGREATKDGEAPLFAEKRPHCGNKFLQIAGSAGGRSQDVRRNHQKPSALSVGHGTGFTVHGAPCALVDTAAAPFIGPLRAARHLES